VKRSARYYDAIYAAAGKDYAKEARAIRSIVAARKRSAGDALLDVACGTGAHLAHLRSWFDVEGLDVSSEMLEVAAARCPDVPLHRADMRDFDLPRRFDAVICLFSAIGYCTTLADLRRAVNAMARHAAPGGIVIIEKWLGPDEFNSGRIDLVVVDEPELKVARLNTTSVDGSVSRLHMQYLAGTPEGIEHFCEDIALGLFTRDQYAAAMSDAGLSATFEPNGFAGRGLFVCDKPLDMEAR